MPLIREVLRRAFARHLECWNKPDREGWIALFDPQVQFDDPVGVPTKHGLEAAAAPDARLVERREAQQAIEEGHRPISVSQPARHEPGRGRDRLWGVLTDPVLEQNPCHDSNLSR